MLKHGAGVLGDPSDIEALIVCGHNLYVTFGSDKVKAIIAEFTDRTFCINWSEAESSLGAAILASKYSCR